MSIGWVNGIARCDIRRQGVPRLGISLGTKSEKEAERRHAAIMVLYEVATPESLALLEQLRGGLVSVERVTQMVERREALIPVAVAATVDTWGTVSYCAARYVTWLVDNPNIEPRTVELATHQLAQFENYEWQGQRVGDMALTAVLSATIMDYQRSMAGRSANVITTYMSRVGGLWRYAQQAEAKEAREQKRPTRDVYSPVDPEMVFREITHRERFLSESELEALFLATPDPLMFPIAAGAMAGLRMEEMLHLRPSIDVDLTLGTITIQKRDGWKPKTPRSSRTVPMTEALWAIAKRHRTEYANDAFMTPSPVNPGMPFTAAAIRKHMIQIVERAGMIYGQKHPSGVVFHTLRHTFASHLAMRGVDLYTVAQLLGDSLNTTENVYAKLSPDSKRAAIAKLAGAFRLPDEIAATIHTEASNAL